MVPFGKKGFNGLAIYKMSISLDVASLLIKSLAMSKEHCFCWMTSNVDYFSHK